MISYTSPATYEQYTSDPSGKKRIKTKYFDTFLNHGAGLYTILVLDIKIYKIIYKNKDSYFLCVNTISFIPQ